MNADDLSVLLINPPGARPCEPPAGLALLAATLEQRGIQHKLWDAGIEGLLELIENGGDGSDTWTIRANRNRSSHISGLRNGKAFLRFDTYTRVIGDLERVLARHHSARYGWHLGLSNITCDMRRPTCSSELLQAVDTPLSDPFVAALRPRFESLLEKNNFTHAGISINYLTQAPSAFALIGLLRIMLPRIRIILGGGLITSWLNRPDWKNPFTGAVDRMVSGPGAEALLDFLGQDPVREPIYPMNSSVGADNMILPGFNELPLESYLSPGLILPLSTAIGCWWKRCAFCPESSEGVDYQPSGTPEEIVTRISRLAQIYKPRLVHLLDDALSPAVLSTLAGSDIGVSWYGFARFGPPLDDPNVCRALARSGCLMLQLGLESGDEGVLEAMGKGIDLAMAGRILHNLNEAGITPYVYLLFGTPAESEPEARATLAFVAKHASVIGFLNLAIFNLPAYGPETASLSTFPIDDSDLGLYRKFEHPRGWNRYKVRRFVNVEFRNHPAIAPILRRDPPVFTSSHAPFFRIK
ncbi:MAG: radical SAM protein [Candidatus Riflebacteria bacterium]|nr:radical SAM protein [Candidatus Riflebacteria bacterium]